MSGRAERMASSQASSAQPGAAQQPVRRNRLGGIRRAGREEPARSTEVRRDQELVRADAEQGGANLRLLNLTGDAGVLEGGVPVVLDGKIVGAIGASGGSSDQDAQTAQAGVTALK